MNDNTIQDNFGNSVASLISQLNTYATSNDWREYGMSVSYADNQYFVSDQNDPATPNNPNYITSGDANSVEINRTYRAYLIAHTHPPGSNPAPSPSDAITLARAYREDDAENITANVVFAADGSQYMVYIEDRSAFNTFCNGPSYYSFINAEGSMFGIGGYDTYYNEVYNNLKTQNYYDNDAQSYALSYVLDYFNTGMKIYEKRNGEFKEQKTEIKYNNNYSPQICQ